MRSSFWKSDFGVAHILCFFLKLAGNITFFSSKTSYLQWNRACEPLQSRFFKNKIRSHIQNPYDRFADLEFPSFTWLCKSFWDLVLGKRSAGKRYFFMLSHSWGRKMDFEIGKSLFQKCPDFPTCLGANCWRRRLSNCISFSFST